MHKTDLIKLCDFNGAANINGTMRPVVYEAADPADANSRSFFLIEGVSIDDAFQILEQLNGGLLKGKDAEQPATKAPVAEAPVVDFAKKAKELKAAKESKAPEQLSLPKVDTKPTPAPVKAAPEPEPEADDEDDFDDDDAPASIEKALDIEHMNGLDKLRDVIEYMVTCGYKTPEQIVSAAVTHKDSVPLLKKVEEKGQFEKRMERNALVVLSGSAN